MQRTLMRTALTTDAAGQAVQLDYYLLTQYAAGLTQYGAEIVMHRGHQQERCAVGCITCLAASITGIIAALAEGTVTPTSMRDILQDIL